MLLWRAEHKHEHRCRERPPCCRRHIRDGNLSRLISKRLFPRCYHRGVRSHRPYWMGLRRYQAARIWFLGYWFFCVMRSGWVSRECKYEEDWIFFFIFCAAGELIELADECKSAALQLPLLPPPHTHTLTHQLWKPVHLRKAAHVFLFYFLFFILPVRLMTADPMHTMKNRCNIFAEERRNKPQQPKAVLSFNRLHQIMESRALMNGWRAVKHTSAG